VFSSSKQFSSLASWKRDIIVIGGNCSLFFCSALLTALLGN
jgi:hypothetical protein